MLKAAQILKSKYEISDDSKVMEKWAREINILEYEDNEIGRIKNIGLATIQHFRMDFGVDTVKPDQRVIEVLENEFKAKKVSQGNCENYEYKRKRARSRYG